VSMSYAQAERLLEMAKTPPGQPSESEAIKTSPPEIPDNSFGSPTPPRGKALEYLTDLANAFDPVEGDVQFDPASWSRIRNAIYDLSTSSPSKCQRCDYPNCFCERKGST
jgi:hypothetical protein